MEINTIKALIRDVKDFPKPGVVYKDITPLFKDAQTIKMCVDALHDLVGKTPIDKVVGVESRGFFFATLLAQRLDAGFVPVRKSGKLPYETVTRSYELEYGTDTLEMHTDAINKGERVLIHDDVLATGGTAKAVCELVEELGGVIVQSNFLIELDFLHGRNLIGEYPVRSLMTF